MRDAFADPQGWQRVRESLRMGCMVLMLIGGSAVLGHFVVVSKIPSVTAAWTISLALPSSVIMAVILLIYLIGGSFVDDMAFMILATPIFFPVAMKLGYDPIWFAVVIGVTEQLGDDGDAGEKECQADAQHQPQRAMQVGRAAGDRQQAGADREGSGAPCDRDVGDAAPHEAAAEDPDAPIPRTVIAMIEARVGRGRWIYVGLGLWRQVPAGTDGAYQLFANLISQGKAPT